MPSALLAALEQQARQRGFDLFGLVDTERFDAGRPKEGRCSGAMPRCGTAIVLGSVGASVAAPGAERALCATLRQHGVRVKLANERRMSISFSCLAEAAGLGTVSPVIHRLLHPQYGPWVAVAAVLLLEGRPFGRVEDASIAERFQPCAKFSRPCVGGCHADVHDGMGRSDDSRCYQERRKGRCADGCGVVDRCPVGAAHRAPVEVLRARHELELRRLALRHGGGLIGSLRRALGL